MGCEVYANGDEIACKAGDNKVIAAMPDVCLSPPSPPAGPVPVPYPNTSFSKDMQNGSKTVVIKGKEVMLKDQSFYKTSPLGDEAATNSLGAGVITHVITGKTYCVAWSMDVKFEGQNVDRHTDLTTSNHASPMANRVAPAATIAVAATAGTPAEPLCKCCGKKAHSQAQRDEDGLSEEQFYDTANNQANKNLLDGIRSSPCKDLLPDPSKPDCNKYYETTPDEQKRIEKVWDDYKRNSRKTHAKSGGRRGHPMTGSYSHKVPKAAGGCPKPVTDGPESNDPPKVGADGKWEGNVAPVAPGCENAEKELESLQKERLLKLRWRTE